MRVLGAHQAGNLQVECVLSGCRSRAPGSASRGTSDRVRLCLLQTCLRIHCQCGLPFHDLEVRTLSTSERRPVRLFLQLRYKPHALQVGHFGIRFLWVGQLCLLLLHLLLRLADFRCVLVRTTNDLAQPVEQENCAKADELRGRSWTAGERAAGGALHTAEKKNMPSANSASIVELIVGQPRNSSPKEPALVRNGARPSSP